MPKSESYRGEDKTLELIRERFEHIEKNEPGAFEACNQAKWDLACEYVYVDFINQGLMQSANAVLKHASDSFKKPIVNNTALDNLGGFD